MDRIFADLRGVEVRLEEHTKQDEKCFKKIDEKLDQLAASSVALSTEIAKTRAVYTFLGWFIAALIGASELIAKLWAN